MVSTYTHTTALKIYQAIDSSGKNGVDIEQLTQLVGLATNTIRTYARWLEDDGSIFIAPVHSDAVNRPLKNLYTAVRSPRPRLTNKEKLNQVIKILEPISEYPETWDNGYKKQLVEAVEAAIRAAL